MTSTNLPANLQQVFERFVTTEYVTVDRRGQPIAWPVTPYWHADEGCIDITTGLGYPKKADDARRNPHVALLFSDPTGSGLEDPPMVLVQGTASVDDQDVKANAERYARESKAKLPKIGRVTLPGPLVKLLPWYTDRIYVHVRPERVYVWPGGDPAAEPELLDSHMEEVRSGHSEEPEEPHSPGAGGGGVWDDRLAEFGSRHPTAVVALIGPDGFPFALRVPIRPDPRARLIHIETDAVGAPFEPGLACLVAHDHSPDFTWQRNFQVRGDLVQTDSGWALAPHRVLGGWEVPPSLVERLRTDPRRLVRWNRTGRHERARRQAS